MAENRSNPASDQPGDASEAQARIPEQPAAAQPRGRDARDQASSEQAPPKRAARAAKAARKAAKKTAAPAEGGRARKAGTAEEPAAAAKPAKRASTERKPAKEAARPTAKADTAAGASAPAKKADSAAANGAATRAEPTPGKRVEAAAGKRSAAPAVPPGAWASAAWDAVRHLDQPPEHLAELAVTELGPRAAAWAQWLRETYPGAPPAGLARLAARQAGRLAFGLTALEAGGPLTAPVQLAATGWVRAMLVLRIAAAHGHDPTDRGRAPELLELLKIGETEQSEPDGTGLPIGRIGLAFSVLRRVRRGRRTPFSTAVRLLLTASEQSDSLDQLAHRAIRRYRAR